MCIGPRSSLSPGLGLLPTEQWWLPALRGLHILHGQKMICAFKTPCSRNLSLPWGNKNTPSLKFYSISFHIYVLKPPRADFCVCARYPLFMFFFYSYLKWRGENRPSLKTVGLLPLSVYRHHSEHWWSFSPTSSWPAALSYFCFNLLFSRMKVVCTTQQARQLSAEGTERFLRGMRRPWRGPWPEWDPSLWPLMQAWPPSSFTAKVRSCS